jgi:hypothetical protein
VEAVDALWPLKKKVAFAIRDDDICFFTQPWMLDTLYKEAWRLGFKVSLAVTPYVKATKQGHVPPRYKGSNKFFLINENKQLVEYLQEKMAEGYVDIVQHGYTHSREGGKPEFAINNFRLVDERLRKGKKLLRETFKRNITVFAAPNEGVSRTTWKSLSRNKMCLTRRFTLGRFLLTAPTYTLDFIKLTKAVISSPNPFKPISTGTIDWADVFVIQWDAFFWSKSHVCMKSQVEDAKAAFHKRLDRKGYFVLAHHYWDYLNWEANEMKRDMEKCLMNFLRMVSSYGEVWKTTLSQIYSQAMHLKHAKGTR